MHPPFTHPAISEHAHAVFVDDLCRKPISASEREFAVQRLVQMAASRSRCPDRAQDAERCALDALRAGASAAAAIHAAVVEVLVRPPSNGASPT